MSIDPANPKARIDLTIHGDPASITTLADSLDRMNDNVCGLARRVSEWATSPSSEWSGESADEFRTTVSHVQVSQLPVTEYLLEVVGALRAYAQRLTWGREYFDEILHSAYEIGLEVEGREILYPRTELGYCPDPSRPYTPGARVPGAQIGTPRGYVDNPNLSPEMNEWQEYTRLVSGYNEAALKVDTWESELSEWLRIHMVPLLQRIGDLVKVADDFDALRNKSEMAIDAALGGFEARMRIDLAGLLEAQDHLSNAALEARETARLGRGPHGLAHEVFDLEGTYTKIGGLDARIGEVAAYSKMLKGTGVVADIVFAAYDMSTGTSEATVLARLAGGMAGNAAGAGLGAGIASTLGSSNPVGFIIVGSIVLGTIGTEFAGSLWQSSVDLDTRERMSHWLEENVFWDSTNGTLLADQ